jgi:hypothetical protein
MHAQQQNYLCAVCVVSNTQYVVKGKWAISCAERFLFSCGHVVIAAELPLPFVWLGLMSSDGSVILCTRHVSHVSLARPFNIR